MDKLKEIGKKRTSRPVNSNSKKELIIINNDELLQLERKIPDLRNYWIQDDVLHLRSQNPILLEQLKNQCLGKKINDDDLIDLKTLNMFKYDDIIINNIKTKINEALQIFKDLKDILIIKEDLNNQLNLHKKFILDEFFSYYIDLSKLIYHKNFINEFEKLLDLLKIDICKLISIKYTEKQHKELWSSFIKNISKIYIKIANIYWEQSKQVKRPALLNRIKNQSAKQKLLFQAQSIGFEKCSQLLTDFILPDLDNDFNNNIPGLKSIRGPYHLVDNKNSTLIRVFSLNKNQLNLLDLAQNSIYKYWLHTLKNSSHQSKEFKERAELFGISQTYTPMVYMSSNYMCIDNKEHQICVDKMLDGIKPLANKVLLDLIKENYPNWYKKCISIQYPNKVKKLFDIFGMLAINFNSTTNFHIDYNDNGLSTIVPVGNWEGGWLVIPQLGIVVKLIKGQVVMLKSSLLYHGNTKVNGNRFSIVFFWKNNHFFNN